MECTDGHAILLVVEVGERSREEVQGRTEEEGKKKQQANKRRLAKAKQAWLD
jgi:hypothetical protein